MNSRAVAKLIRELSAESAERARMLLLLAEAFEAEEDAPADERPRRVRGLGSLLLPPLGHVNALDQQAAANALQAAGVVPRKKAR